MMTRSLAIAVVALSAIGCTRDLAGYPSHWAPIDPLTDCRTIVGTYRQDGEGFPGPRPSYSRLTELTAGGSFDLRGPYVTLLFPAPDVFMIKAEGERRFRLKEGRAACRHRTLELRRRSWHAWVYAAWLFGADIEYQTVALSRSRDGWLIARWDSRHVGFLYFFIPMGSSLDREWYRFEPVPISELAQPKSEAVTRQVPEGLPLLTPHEPQVPPQGLPSPQELPRPFPRSPYVHQSPYR